MAATSSPQTLAQMIHTDTQALRQDMAIILKLARDTALPMAGEETSVLAAMLALLQMIVTKTEQNAQAIEALHQALNQPGIAQVLRRMLDTE